MTDREKKWRSIAWFELGMLLGYIAADIYRSLT